MLDKFKQIKQLKNLQTAIKKEKVEVEKEGVKVVVSGAMEVEEISLNKDLSKEKQETVLKQCFNEAMKKIRRKIAGQLSQMG